MFTQKVLEKQRFSVFYVYLSRVYSNSYLKSTEILSKSKHRCVENNCYQKSTEILSKILHIWSKICCENNLFKFHNR